MQTQHLKTMIFGKSTLATAFAAVVLGLAGCGGGGGGSSPAASATNYTATCADNTTQTSTVSNADALGKCSAGISTIVNVPLPAASTYAANGQTEELAAFNFLNSERSRCGFGTLRQSAALDAAGKAHADWMIANNIASHSESAGTTGYTGVGPDARDAFAGYLNPGMVNEGFVQYSGVTNKQGYGVSGLRTLLNAPFHAAGMLLYWRDVGIAVRSTPDIANPLMQGVVVDFEYGYTNSSGSQLLSSSDVVTYPCQGTTGTDVRMIEETPNPFTNADGSPRNLYANPIGGIVTIQVRNGNTIAINNASMINVATGETVPMFAPQAPFFMQNSALVGADVPLLPNTAYQVTINGLNNGAAFSRTFTFTTGTGG